MRAKHAVCGLLFAAVLAAALLVPAVARAADDPWAFQADKLKVWGFFQVWFVSDSTDNLASDNTFRIRRARLGVQGTTAKGLITYSLLAGMDPTTATTGTSGVTLYEAWGQVNLHPWFNIRAGQTKPHFTAEAPMSDLDTPFILRANAIDAITVRYGTEGTSQRDIGIEFNGAGKLGGNFGAEYRLGVWNGNGANAVDNNSNKDITGRLILTPIPGVSLGGSFITGKEAAGGGVQNDINGWAVELFAHQGPLRGGFEYVVLKKENSGGAALSTKPQGWYVYAGYKVLPNLELLARYDTFDQDKNTPNNTIDNFTLAGVYTFKKATKLSVNYIFVNADSGVNTGAASGTNFIGNTWPNQLANGAAKAGTTIGGAQLDNILLVQLQVAF
ncbi:MAG: hypothetical protein HZA23_07240 [Nitrospirae bacterium]|nr:hypothetical protein [Nitrospirota bacterium]